MPNKKGLGVSRKFYDGSVHENGTGRLMILNRYEGEDGMPWLEFQWLSGDKEGQAENNKEANVSASIHKFQTIKKAAGNPIQPYPSNRDKEEHIPIVEMVAEIYSMLKSNRDKLLGLEDMVQQNQMKLEKSVVHFKEMKDSLDRIIHRHDILNKQQDTITKLIDRLPTSTK